MRIGPWIIAAAAIVILGSAEPVWAWGPATHVGLAGSVLDSLVLLPAAVAATLGRNRRAFLYGNIATDVVFAKRLSRIKQFCHHWSTAFRLLNGAEDDQAKAFAFGYLAHLAADTVAHGKFVPHQITVNNTSVNFGHFYWELRADAAETESTWQRLERLLDRDHARHHQALAVHLTETLLPYSLNRRLFEVFNAVALRRSFRRTVDVWGRCSRWYLSPQLMSGYRAESLERIHSILTEGANSALLREDPNGTSVLMNLRVHRRGLRRRRRRGLPVHRHRMEKALGYAPRPASDRHGDRRPPPRIPVPPA